MSESYDEHRKRDENNAISFLLFNSFTGWFSWLIPVIILAIIAAWIINILGTSTILNNPEIYYSGVNKWTGKTEVVKGCRPENLTVDRKCDNEINIELIKKSFPFFGKTN